MKKCRVVVSSEATRIPYAPIYGVLYGARVPDRVETFASIGEDFSIAEFTLNLPKGSSR